MAVKDHMIKYKRISIQFFKLKQSVPKDGNNGSIETKEEVLDSGKYSSNFPRSLELIEQKAESSKGSNIPSKFSIFRQKATSKDNEDNQLEAGTMEKIVPVLSEPIVHLMSQRWHKDFYASIKKVTDLRAIAMADHSNLRLNYS